MKRVTEAWLIKAGDFRSAAERRVHPQSHPKPFGPLAFLKEHDYGV